MVDERLDGPSQCPVADLGAGAVTVVGGAGG